MGSEEIAEEYKKNHTNKLRNLASRIGLVHILIFGVIVLILFSMSKNNADPKFSYIIYAILGGIILMLWYKPDKEKKLLTKEKAIEIAQAEADLMVRNGKEFSFNSKVIAGPQCHLRYTDDVAEGFAGPVAWDVEINEFVQGTQYVKSGFFSIHPYDGICTGFFWCRFGFNPRESRDVKIIPVGIVQGNVKNTDFEHSK